MPAAVSLMQPFGAQRPVKQLAAYHLDIDCPFWSIRNRKNLHDAGCRVRQGPVQHGFSWIPFPRCFPGIPRVSL